MKWSLKTSAWESNYQHAREYYLEHGDLAVMQSYVCADGFKLGVWLSNLRTKYRTDKLTSNQIRQLESIGMVWKKSDAKWGSEFAHAKAYYEMSGNLQIPAHYVCEDGYRLGAWLKSVRISYKKVLLSEEKIKLLESMGIVWNSYDYAWKNGFAHAKTYFEQHGNLNINAVYVCGDGFKFGEWKYRQIQRIACGKMEKDRLELLQQIGIGCGDVGQRSTSDKYGSPYSLRMVI